MAVETVYRSASGKAGLLADAVRAAVAGGAERAEVPVTERPAIRRITEETDPVRQLQLYAATQPGIWSRVGPLLRVLDAAANSDASLVELRERIAAERRHGLRDGLGRMLEQRGVLRDGVTAERAGDIVYAVCGQANYVALVGDCGWTRGGLRGLAGRDAGRSTAARARRMTRGQSPSAICLIAARRRSHSAPMASSRCAVALSCDPMTR